MCLAMEFYYLSGFNWVRLNAGNLRRPPETAGLLYSDFAFVAFLALQGRQRWGSCGQLQSHECLANVEHAETLKGSTALLSPVVGQNPAAVASLWHWPSQGGR